MNILISFITLYILITNITNNVLASAQANEFAQSSTGSIKEETEAISESVLLHLGRISHELYQDFEKKCIALESARGYHMALNGLSAYLILDIDRYGPSTFSFEENQIAEAHKKFIEDEARNLGLAPKKSDIISEAIRQGINHKTAVMAYRMITAEDEEEQ